MINIGIAHMHFNCYQAHKSQVCEFLITQLPNTQITECVSF
jgi:hypothetical protein